MAIQKGPLAALLLAALTNAQRLECPYPPANGLASQMLNSTIARGQGIGSSGAATSLIELGIFQQALRESIAHTINPDQKQAWTQYLSSSVSTAAEGLQNATANAEMPLDRFSIGTSLLDEGNNTAVEALWKSASLQPRNANGALWYFNNPKNLSAYHNLTYTDGIFSFPPFAALSNDSDAALEQIQLLYDACHTSSGLLVHGADPTHSHAWASKNAYGSSPAVWGRALGWYTLGVVNTLPLLDSASSEFSTLKKLYLGLVRAQLTASDRSLNIAGSYGVWQLVEYPEATFSGHKNFIEASASALTAYNFLRGAREGWLDEDEDVKNRALSAGMGIFRNQMHEPFLVQEGEGLIGLNGTSSVATLSGDVNFVYYATRPTVYNSLIGTSAFILAGLEVEKICP